MSQNDLVISNQTFPSTRADINNALQALGSLNSGSSEPATKYANMMWYDTANNILKMRSEANDVWISVGYLDQTSDAFRIFDDTQVVNTSGIQTGLIGDQSTATWQAGTSTTQSLVSPANVKAAIQSLGSNVTLTEFTSSGTYTKPAGANFIYVVAVGGGGSGTAWTTTSTNQLSAGGGTGGVVSAAYYVASVVPSTVSVTVGSGAAGVNSINNFKDGTAGGNSSFGTILSASGGAGTSSTYSVGTVAVQQEFGLIPLNGGTGVSGGAGTAPSRLGTVGGSGAGNLILNVTTAGGISLAFGNGGFSRSTTTSGLSAGNGGFPGGGGGGIFFRGNGNSTSGGGGNGVVRVYSW